MGISKEVVQRERELKIIKEDDMTKPKKSKLVPTPLKQAKQRQSQSGPTSSVQKPIPSPKSQSTSSTGGAEKRKKEKPQRVYVATTGENIETESDKVVKEEPLIIEVSEKETKETVNVENAEDYDEKGGNDESVEAGEKGEKEKDQAPTIVARDTGVDKGKQIATNSNDFGQGPIDIS
ncbi:uncharacterized protein C13E7.07-like [Cryptomeria japonica]|uniref:uncharacterized protein C13E7.07-like n=1 Tax=Cryptomeria japonica TaxID=3369 RepID=UPI0027DA8D48|nr:uncharacterized protein C13E7.07-like [Cryptomeria japonica]